MSDFFSIISHLVRVTTFSSHIFQTFMLKVNVSCQSSCICKVVNNYKVRNLVLCAVFALVKNECETDCLPSLEKARQL